MALDQLRRGNFFAAIVALYGRPNLRRSQDPDSVIYLVTGRELAARWQQEHLSLLYPGRTQPSTYDNSWPAYLVNEPHHVNDQWWLHMDLLPRAYRNVPEGLRKAVELPLRVRYEGPSVREREESAP